MYVMDVMGKSLYWIGVVGLVGLLAVGGCSKKGAVGTTSGAETAQVGARADGGAGGGGMTQPRDTQAQADTGALGSPGGGGMTQPGDAKAKADSGTSGSSGGSMGVGSGSPGIGSGSPGAGGGSPGIGSGSPGAGGGSLGSGSGSLGGPVQGISKSPKDEGVQSPPMVVAKADQAEIAARQAREAAQKQLADIYFAFDKWALSAEGKKNLTQSAEALKQIPTVKLVIEGHCDERGSREYNLVLGEKRAKETERFLLGLGITNPVLVTSFGKERPVCSEHDESCYWKNRRAHLVLEEAK
jgi:peptidoglycan-associated lipoprotein